MMYLGIDPDILFTILVITILIKLIRQITELIFFIKGSNQDLEIKNLDIELKKVKLKKEKKKIRQKNRK